MKYNPLSCELYDFVETICMRHASIEVETLDGTLIKAKALSTKTSALKEEYLQVESPGLIREVRLDMILAITVCSPGSIRHRQEFVGRGGRYSCIFHQDEM